MPDTDLYQKDFNFKRLIHKDDISEKTNHFEIILGGEEDYPIDEKRRSKYIEAVKRARHDDDYSELISIMYTR